MLLTTGAVNSAPLAWANIFIAEYSMSFFTTSTSTWRPQQYVMYAYMAHEVWKGKMKWSKFASVIWGGVRVPSKFGPTRTFFEEEKLATSNVGGTCHVNHNVFLFYYYCQWKQDMLRSRIKLMSTIQCLIFWTRMGTVQNKNYTLKCRKLGTTLQAKHLNNVQ